MAIPLIRRVVEEDLAEVRAVFREYAAGVGNAICFQSFEKEVEGLPGDYAPPRGCLLAAFSVSGVVGCVGLRSLPDGTAEMKRLYVRPEFRGTGLGRELVLAALVAARELGYAVVRLDTLPSMTGAIALYKSLSFREIPPYGGNPETALCFEITVVS
jgi:putative acetyltransferase